MNTRAYLQNIAINTNSKPTINEISKDTIEYLNTTLNISKLEFFFKELINQCSNLLYNNLLDILKDDLLYKLNPDSIKDDIFNKSIRFYFKNNTNLSSWDDFLCAGAMVLGPQYHGSGGEKTTPDYYIFN